MDFTGKALLKELDSSSDSELDLGEFVCLWYAYKEDRSKEDVAIEIA